MSGDETADTKNVAHLKRGIQRLTRPTRLIWKPKITCLIGDHTSILYYARGTYILPGNPLSSILTQATK